MKMRNGVSDESVISRAQLARLYSNFHGAEGRGSRFDGPGGKRQDCRTPSRWRVVLGRKVEGLIWEK